MNDEIFKTKIRNYYDTVFRTCMAYLQNSHDAEDITEEVFITYYYKSPDFENESLEKSNNGKVEFLCLKADTKI